VDDLGNIYVADQLSHTVRKGTPLAQAAPALSISAQYGQVVLSWPAGFRLETSSGLSRSASWTLLNNGITTNGATLTLTNRPSVSPAFYRLHYFGN
jgi:hypothetical protein